MDFPGHFKHIFQQLNQQRAHGQLCDCVIAVGDQRFRAHRSILAACSTHFRALLSTADEGGGGGRGGGSGRGLAGVMELDPEVVTPEAFTALLDMIYTSTLTLGSANVMDVLLAASHLHLNSAVKACKHHLSSRDVPTLPPCGWRSPAQQQCGGCPGDQQTTRPSWSQAEAVSADDTRRQMTDVLDQLRLSLIPSALAGGFNAGEAGAEAGLPASEDGGVLGTGGGGMEQGAGFPTTTRHLHKRKLSSGEVFQEEGPSSRRRDGWRGAENCGGVGFLGKAGSTTDAVGAEELPSLGALKTDEDDIFLGMGAEAEEEEVEEKYETGRGVAAALEEAQSRCSAERSQGDGGEDHRHDSLPDGGMTVKVKIGEEEEVEEKIEVVEVKSEHLGSSYPDTPGIPSNPPSPLEESGDHQEYDTPGDKKVLSRLPDAQPYSEAQAENTDSTEALDGHQDLGLSCPLSPAAELVSGPDEGVLPNATLNGATTEEGPLALALSPSQVMDATTNGCSSSSSSSSSLVFPVASVPLQQLFSGQAHGLSDTFFLQSSQSSQGGFLQGVRPTMGPPALGSFSLHPPLALPSRARTAERGRGSSLGGPSFRRIAPKVDPSPQTDSSSSTPPEGAVPAPPVLTRASDDVVSKCKKALMDHNVLVVEGERKYACRMCSKTFLNLTDCRKHIRVHTGERPYACRNCGKRFSQTSHLYKHYKTTCLCRAAPCENLVSSQTPV